jgi:hypothetical protein
VLPPWGAAVLQGRSGRIAQQFRSVCEGLAVLAIIRRRYIWASLLAMASLMPNAWGEDAKQPAGAISDSDLFIGKDDFDTLLGELDRAIKSTERTFVLEGGITRDYIANWAKSDQQHVSDLAHYVRLSDTTRASAELLKRFQATQFATTRWMLSKFMCACPDEAVMVSLKTAWERETYTPYRFDLLSAYVQCSAWCRLEFYAEALKDKKEAFFGELGGGGPAIGTSSNLATRELARMIKLGPPIAEKDRGLDIDRQDADRWRDWFTQNGPYLRLDNCGRYFWIDEDARACAVPTRDWDRLFWERRDELAKKVGRRIAAEFPGETVPGKVERLTSCLERGASAIDRRSAALRLGRMGFDAKSAIPSMTARLRQEESQSVCNAIKAALTQLQAAPMPLHAE